MTIDEGRSPKGRRSALPKLAKAPPPGVEGKLAEAFFRQRKMP